jgi:hypothetical protein
LRNGIVNASRSFVNRGLCPKNSALTYCEHRQQAENNRHAAKCDVLPEGFVDKSVSHGNRLLFPGVNAASRLTTMLEMHRRLSVIVFATNRLLTLSSDNPMI